MIGSYIHTIQTKPNTHLALLRLAVTHSDTQVRSTRDIWNDRM